MARTKAQEAERAEWVAKLRDTLRPGDTITTVLRHRSASGMYRAIDLYRFTCDDGKVRREWLSYWTAHAGIGRWDDRREAVGVSGAGMDMGFHLVYSLSLVAFPDGFGCIGGGCPSNDHRNGDLDRTPHTCEQGVFPEQHGRDYHNAHTGTVDAGACHWHADGGYALRHEWL